MKLTNIATLKGTNQNDRALKSLATNHVAVEERTTEQLLEFIMRYAEHLDYYDIHAQVDGKWSDFFNDLTAAELSAYLANPEDFRQDEKYQRYSQPYISLLLIFLTLLKHPQQQFRDLTQRHLDFYYRDVLQLQTKPALTNQVNVVFNLEDDAEFHTLKQGTLLAAGEDSLGNDVVYGLDSDLTISQAQLAKVNTLTFKKTADDKITGIVVSSPYDTSTAKTFEPKGFDTFGISALDSAQADGKYPSYAIDMGLIISSPILNLASGKRTITLKLFCRHQQTPLSQAQYKSLFDVSVSGGDSWLTPVLSEQVAIEGSLVTMTQTLVIDTNQAAVAVPSTELDSTLSVVNPVIRLLIKPLDSNPAKNNSYQLLKDLALEKIELQVNVEGLKELTLRNDEGVIDAQNSFEPFGSAPDIGNGFYFSAPELVNKRVDKLDLSLEWMDLPSDFATYYKAYSDTKVFSEQINDANLKTNGIENTSFKVGLKRYDKREFHTLGVTEPLFDNQLKGNKTLAYKQIDDTADVINSSDIGSEDLFDWPRYFKLELSEPDFLHSMYPLVAAENANLLSHYRQYEQVKAAREADNAYCNAQDSGGAEGKYQKAIKILNDFDSAQSSPTKAELAEAQNTIQNYLAAKTRIEQADQTLKEIIGLANKHLPVNLQINSETELFNQPGKVNEPYTPKIKSIQLSYSSSVSINLNSLADGQQVIQINPFGKTSIAKAGLYNSASRTTVYPFLANYGAAAYLFLGIDKLLPPQNLSLLVQKLPGSGEQDLAAPAISWSYLAQDVWQPLPKDKLLLDTTRGLLNTGILKFAIPADATASNELFAGNLYWLKAEITSNVAAIGKTLDIRTQAASATFIDQNNAADYLKQPLAANSISDLVVSDALIKTVSQPYASNNGRIAEGDSGFITRVSERLRHRHRGLTGWDYERLVLEHFPEIYKVKCITQSSQASFYDPAKVILLVIPSAVNAESIYTLQPKAPLYLLEEIKEYLAKYVPPFVNLEVKNPTYQELIYSIAVKFRKGYEQTLYVQQLNEQLVRFLSPWAYGQQGSIDFGNVVYGSSIIRFIEELPYVDYLGSLELISQGNTLVISDNLDSVSSNDPSVILVSAASHTIEMLSSNQAVPPFQFGIGHNKIGVDFYVG